MKRCSRCKLDKDYSEYSRRLKSNDGLQSACKICESNNKKIYYSINKNKICDRMKRYSITNKEKIKDYKIKNINKITIKIHKWRQKESTKENRRNYETFKRNTDVNYKLRRNLRRRLNHIIKKKSGSAIKDLGCSVEKLELWLEMNWLDGMSWENYGTKGWHIDHIKPLSHFDLTNRAEFLEANHFSNLQPLWWKDNLTKSDKICLK